MTTHGTLPSLDLPSPAAPQGRAATALGVTAETRIPLSGGRLKLSTPKIPGYHCHWFADRSDRVEAAVAAGYEFVEKGEVSVNNLGVAREAATGAGTDLGSRVSIVAGGDNNGQALRLVLMKIRQEWRDKDMRARENSSDALVAALTRGQAGSAQMPGEADTSHRYIGEGGGRRPQKSIFTKRT